MGIIDWVAVFNWELIAIKVGRYGHENGGHENFFVKFVKSTCQ